VTALLAAPMLLSALAVGLFVGMIQAATQIQEMTLTFIPKLVVLVFALLVAGSWMLGLITDFSIRLIENIPVMIG
jgi:flagellar biosynthetic protein FliQ